MKAKYKFLIFFFLLSVVCSGLFAQEKHFIYIQADNKQPFYVILNGKNYSSSSIGYIILSKLDNGNYTIIIGFPKNIYPEQKFNLTVDNKDYGYALKNFGDKGWGLFDLQSMDVTMANSNADTTVNNIASSQPAKQNPFGEMLSDVVNDSTLTRNNAVSSVDTNTTNVEVDTVNTQAASVETNVQEENTPDSTPVATNATTEPEQDAADSTSVATNANTRQEENEDTSATPGDFDTKGIIKAEETNTTDGTNLVFIDFNKSANDTIRVFIPANASSTNSEGTTAAASTVTTPAETSVDSSTMASSLKNNNSVPANNSITTIDNITSSSGNKEENSSNDSGKQVSNPFFNGTVDNNKDANTEAEQSQTDSTPAAATSDKPMVRASCNEMVNDKDITKLKRKLVTETETDAMIQTVKKGLKGKCISTDNVKELGRLFISDESRYTFFDAIYPFVYDYGSFSSLEDQLFDNYYRNRFKALLR